MRPSDEELLEHLKGLNAEAGYLSGELIDQDARHAVEFGLSDPLQVALSRAYEKIGYWVGYDQERIAVNERLRVLYPEVIARVERAILAVGGCGARREGGSIHHQ